MEARRRRKVAVLDMPKSKIGKVEVPVRPFFGTIGTAPRARSASARWFPAPHGANMDFNEVVQGVTLYFPVFEPGALFMLGDGHAAQGDGEIMGAAIETSFDVQFTVEVIKGKKIEWPRLENDKYIMSIGSTRPLMDALRLACSDMVNWLSQDYGYDKMEASSCWARRRNQDRQRRGSAVLGGLRGRQEVPAAVAALRVAGRDRGPRSPAGSPGEPDGRFPAPGRRADVVDPRRKPRSICSSASRSRACSRSWCRPGPDAFLRHRQGQVGAVGGGARRAAAALLLRRAADALGLRRQGATKGATVAFLIATPETGVDSISLSYALMDPLMTMFRPYCPGSLLPSPPASSRTRLV